MIKKKLSKGHRCIRNIYNRRDIKVLWHLYTTYIDTLKININIPAGLYEELLQIRSTGKYSCLSCCKTWYSVNDVCPWPDHARTIGRRGKKFLQKQHNNHTTVGLKYEYASPL
jgi:hypothetical protein